MFEIIPAIFTNNPQELREMLSRIEGIVERAQIDIVDGRFADSKTLDPSVLADIDTSLKLDFQLMVKEPINWVEKCISGQADRIIGQIEAMRDQTEFIGKVQEVGASVGLAIDIVTEVSEIDPAILNDLDVVLVMSVAAGFGGQKFEKRALDKIKKLGEIRARDDTPFRICVDGGVTTENIAEIRKKGADEVAIGRRIFEGDFENNIKKFQEIAYFKKDERVRKTFGL